MLITHRNLNFISTVVTTSMALWRVNHRKPNAAYLGAGGVGVLAYTAYLGGKLVYNVGLVLSQPQCLSKRCAEAEARAGRFVRQDGGNGPRAWRAAIWSRR